jgi:hypothetical protein
MAAQVGFGASISASDYTYQLVGFGAPNWPSLYGLLRVTTMPESLRNNARIPKYLGRCDQVDVAGGGPRPFAPRSQTEIDSTLRPAGNAQTRVFRSGWRERVGER